MGGSTQDIFNTEKFIQDASNTITKAYNDTLAERDRFSKANPDLVKVASDIGRVLVDTTVPGGIFSEVANATSGDKVLSGVDVGVKGDNNTADVPKIKTTTNLGVGDIASGTGETFNEEEAKRKAIKKKKLGARALQIPLTAPKATTQASGVASSVPTTGLQI